MRKKVASQPVFHDDTLTAWDIEIRGSIPSSTTLCIRRIIRLEIPWDRPGYKLSKVVPNSVLGHILIDEQPLSAEANSAQRAKALRSEIDKRSGNSARFKVDEIQDPSSMMDEREEGRPTRGNILEQNGLMKHSEVRAQVSEIKGKGHILCLQICLPPFPHQDALPLFNIF